MNRILHILAILTLFNTISRSQIMNIRDNNFYLDPKVIRENQFKIVEFYVQEFFFITTNPSIGPVRKVYDRYRLRLYINSEGFPDSIYYFSEARKKSRKWVKDWLYHYYRFLPDSLKEIGASKTEYNSKGLLARSELKSESYHSCCNPYISIDKYFYNERGQILSLEIIQKNSTPTIVADSTRFEFDYRPDIQEVKKFSLYEKHNSRLICFNKNDVIEQIVVIDARVNDISLKVDVIYGK